MDEFKLCNINIKNNCTKIPRNVDDVELISRIYTTYCQTLGTTTVSI